MDEYWSDRLQAFWIGGNGCEYIAWKGSHQILIYPCDDYPNPPSGIIQYSKRIENSNDFVDCMKNGIEMNANYEKVVKR